MRVQSDGENDRRLFTIASILEAWKLANGLEMLLFHGLHTQVNEK